MTEQQNSVRPVPGEMRPWSDFDGEIGAMGGATVKRWLSEVLPTGGRWLIVGPHDEHVVTMAADRADSFTLLCRSASDAESIHARLPRPFDIVAGSLDGVPIADGPYDVIVAADGLDRVLTPDSLDLSWVQRLRLIDGLAGPDAVIVLGLSNEFGVSTLLDARVARDRHGDEEWRPLHSDLTRPCSSIQLREAMTKIGRAPTGQWVTFGPNAGPSLIAEVSTTNAARPGHLVATVAAQAAGTTTSKLLAQPNEAIVSASRAGLLASVADGFLLVTGDRAGTPTGEAYYAVGKDEWVARLDHTEEQSAWVVTGSDGREVRSPDAPTVESELRALAEREAVPAFREYAARLGRWVTDAHLTMPVAFDRLVPDGQFFAPVTTSETTAELSPEAALAGGWFRFQDRLVREHRRHPWPPWVLGPELVAIWSSMAGVPLDDSHLSAGRVSADLLADPQPLVVHTRTALADQEELVRQLSEAKGHIFGLERTIGFRDKQLLTRERRIHKLHQDLKHVEKVRAHPAYKAAKQAMKLRDPEKVVVVVKGRISSSRSARKVVSIAKKAAAGRWRHTR